MKKLEVTITYRLELTVDDRVQPRDIEWAISRAFETSDGRQPLSCELATDGVTGLCSTPGERIYCIEQ